MKFGETAIVISEYNRRENIIKLLYDFGLIEVENGEYEGSYQWLDLANECSDRMEVLIKRPLNQLRFII